MTGDGTYTACSVKEIASPHRPTRLEATEFWYCSSSSLVISFMQNIFVYLKGRIISPKERCEHLTHYKHTLYNISYTKYLRGYIHYLARRKMHLE